MQFAFKKNKMTQIIELLQNTVNGILNGSQQHLIHGTINIHKGYLKLGDHMLKESNDEVKDAERFINRILELGGCPTLEAVPYKIYMDVESQLKIEYQEQVEGLKSLEDSIRNLDLDKVTENMFIEYLAEETNHTTWLHRQINLIEEVGLQNYLASQL